MAFKDVKQNYSVYILNKQDITITDGKVISVGFPHLDFKYKACNGLVTNGCRCNYRS